MRLKKTFNVVVLSVFSFGKYRILTYTERYQRSFEVARATYKYQKTSKNHTYYRPKKSKKVTDNET